MKKSRKFRHLVLSIAVTVGLAACKKNKEEPAPTPNETVNLTVTELKAKSTSESVTLNETGKIFKVKGVVISDKDTKNIDANTAVIAQEDNAAGIVVNFAAAHSLAAGTEVEIEVSNQKLVKKDGEITLEAIPVANAKSLGTGKAITPRETTIANIITNKAAWNGTLVKIVATGYSSANSKYTGTLTIRDASGDLKSEIATTATFADEDLLPSVNSITGVIRIKGNDTFIHLRNKQDVVIGDVSRVVNIDFVAGELFPTEWAHHTALLPGTLLGDGGFTEAGKNYGYIFESNGSFDQSGAFVAQDVKFNKDFVPGYKTVTVTFAGSLVSGVVDKQRLNLSNFIGGPFDFTNPFNPQTDEYKIGIRLFDGINSKYTIKSEPIKEAGKFFTVKFNIPTTQEQLMAGGLEDWVADAWLKKPTFIVINYSNSNRMPGQPNRTPILISKIEVGY